jgi:hypothetical protein
VSVPVLASYINDHLAGSVVALELVEHLAEISKSTERERLFLTLRDEIKEDQEVLKQLLRDLGRRRARLGRPLPG